MKRAPFLLSSLLGVLAFASSAPLARAQTRALDSALEAARTTDYPAAEKALLAVEGAERPAALVALARVMLEQGRFAEAEKYASLAAATAGPQKLVGLAVKARVLAAQGKVDEAIKLLEPQKSGAGTGGRSVRLELGELLIRAGRRAEAEPVLMECASESGNDSIAQTDGEGLAMVGRAMQLLRHPKDANRAYNESERADAGTGSKPGSRLRVQTSLWRADLWFDNYDPGHAGQELEEVLKVAPHCAEAKVMLARAKVEDAFDFEAGEKLVGEALAVNPKSTGAFAVRATMALRDGNLAASTSAVDAGLAVDPNDLELLSLRAAIRFLADDRAGYEAAKREIFRRNKEYSRAYSIIGDHAEWEHRYDDIVTMMKEAVALDPADRKAWAQLGLMQTRAGDEAEGVKSLEEAWKGDHFNVRVYNTLELLYGQWIPQKYESAQSGIFRLRYPKAEKAVLERYVPRMLGEAWGVMKEHYMFAPSTPVGVEMYLDRQHFSVRTSGLPNIGIQGVCFGHVVAAMSPESEPFNWGNVIWHELGHVFAIQLSKNHVPRWFTEGLSEYETMIRRPEWQRELDPELYLALKKNELPGAVEMNRAFTHANGDLDVTVAYYAASQMLAFTAEQFGFPKITRALELWGQGKETPAVIREAFGVSPQEYDEQFRRWAMARLSRYDSQYMFDLKPGSMEEAQAAAKANPQNAAAQVRLAVALLREHKADEAAHAIDEALRLDPKQKDALYLAAKLAGRTKDAASQQKHLMALRAAGGDGYAVEMALAEVAQAAHDKATLRVALESAHRFDPSQPDPLRGLYELASDNKNEGEALEALREVARLDQHDRRAYRMLLDKLVDMKRWDEAKQVGEAALYVDVESAGIHTAYARALAATGDHRTASFELESGLLCEAKAPELSTMHALLAAERLAVGDAAGARTHRDQALQLDPNNATAKALKL